MLSLFVVTLFLWYRYAKYNCIDYALYHFFLRQFKLWYRFLPKALYKSIMNDVFKFLLQKPQYCVLSMDLRYFGSGEWKGLLSVFIDSPLYKSLSLRNDRSLRDSQIYKPYTGMLWASAGICVALPSLT